jgi:hypothetical protein
MVKAIGVGLSSGWWRFFQGHSMGDQPTLRQVPIVRDDEQWSQCAEQLFECLG